MVAKRLAKNQLKLHQPLLLQPYRVTNLSMYDIYSQGRIQGGDKAVTKIQLSLLQHHKVVNKIVFSVNIKKGMMCSVYTVQAINGQMAYHDKLL